MLCRGAHDVFRDVRHQQADDDQHHADSPAHRCHGDHNVLHPGRRQRELHAVPLLLPLGWLGAAQVAQTDAVRDVLVQLGEQKVPAARPKMDTGALKLSVAAIPPAAYLVAPASVASTPENRV